MGKGLSCIADHHTKSTDELIEEVNLLRQRVDELELMTAGEKQIHRKLQESEARYRMLYEDNPAMYFTLDSTGKVLDVNTFGAEQLGYRAAELTGESVLKVFHPEDRKAVQKQMQICLDNPGNVIKWELRKVHKNGQTLWVEESARAIPGPGGELIVLVVCEDITERKMVDKQILEQQKFLKKVINSLPHPFYVIDAKDYSVIMSNEAAGLESGLTCHQQTHQLDTPCFNHGHQCPLQMVRQHQEPQVVEHLHRDKNGGYRVYQVNGCPILDDDGNVTQMIEYNIDVTEYRKAEAAVRASEARYRAVVEQSAESIFLLDIETEKVLESNRAFQQLLGYSESELKALTVYDFVAHDREEIEANTRRILREKECQLGERKYRRKDGSRVDVEVNISTIHYDGKAVHCVVARDLSERKQMEMERLKAQKLESLGVLAGGIAHDFNNILTVILGNISLAKMSADNDMAIHARLASAEKAMVHAQRLTGQLLTFSKGGAPVKKTMCIADLISESVRFVLQGATARAEFSLPKNLWPVAIDAGQINQVINNIVINARQAMSDGGVIRISGNNISTPEKDSTLSQTGKYVHISIADEGIGIAPEVLPKIFDPYFTDKAGGSGLGLATSYSIVKNHGGTITVESEFGKGSVFHIYLQASENTPLSVDLSSAETLIRGDGQILVMDDKAAIRETAKEMLTHLGFTVALASHGEEALEMYRSAFRAGHPYDAVILDLTVPGKMGGRETVAYLKEFDPTVRALASTGYSADALIAEYHKHGFCGAIHKPYNLSKMSDALKTVLQKK